MKVLIACESSGQIRDAFRRHWAHAQVMSCDLLPTTSPGPHYQGDVRDVLDGGWDLMIAHPSCQYLTSSGLHWNNKVPGRTKLTEEALSFVLLLMNAPIKHIAIENPVGRIGTAIRPADQYIQPYEFGSDASKRTGLWLKNLPALTIDPMQYVEPRIVDGKKRWANQTDSGQNRLTPSPDRWKERSETYPGIANQIALQWGAHVTCALRGD